MATGVIVNSCSTTTLPSQLQLNGIRKSVLRIPPARFMLQTKRKIIPLDGKQMWEDNIDDSEDDDYFESNISILPHMTGDPDTRAY